MLDIEAAWLAGLIDGEATFRIKQINREKGRAIRRHQPFLEIGMTNLAIINRVKEITGLGTIKLQAKLTSRGKKVWRWCAVSRGAGTVARAVLLYLIVKREQAELLIAICDNLASRAWGDTTAVAPDILDWRDHCYYSMKALNQCENIRALGNSCNVPIEPAGLAPSRKAAGL